MKTTDFRSYLRRAFWRNLKLDGARRHCTVIGLEANFCRDLISAEVQSTAAGNSRSKFFANHMKKLKLKQCLQAEDHQGLLCDRICANFTDASHGQHQRRKLGQGYIYV